MSNETWGHLLDALEMYRDPAIQEMCTDLEGFVKKRIAPPLHQFETLAREQVQGMVLDSTDLLAAFKTEPETDL